VTTPNSLEGENQSSRHGEAPELKAAAAFLSVNCFDYFFFPSQKQALFGEKNYNK